MSPLFSRKSPDDPYIPYAAKFYGQPGCIYVAQEAGKDRVWRIGLTVAARPEDRIERLRRETQQDWRLVWWKYSKDCGRAKAQAFKALSNCKRTTPDGSVFVADFSVIKDVVKRACDKPRQRIAPIAAPAGFTRFRFTIFRAQADGNWYWFLRDQQAGRAIARGNPCASRDACLLDVRSLLGAAASAEIIDADSGEMVAVSA